MADRYWVGGSGTWDSTTTTNWSATSGGAGGASAPTSADNVIFNSASNATLYTVTMGTSAVCADMTMAGPTSGNVTWAGSTALSIYGSMTLSATGITRTYTGTITFAATTTGKTVTTNGVALGGAVTFNGVGGGWTLGSALTTTGATTLTNGALDLGTFTLTCSSFDSNNSNTRTLAFGTGNITLTGNNATIWTTQTATNLTFTGTPVVNCTYSGATGTRYVQTASTSPSTAISVNVTAGTDIVSFNLGDSSFNDVNFTGFSGSFSIGSTIKIYGSMTLSTGMTVTPSGNTIIFAATSGTKTFTTNGRTVDTQINFGSPDFATTAIWQLADNLTVGSTRTVQLLYATLDLNNKTLTAGYFNSNNANVRSIAFGTGNVTLTGSGGFIWNCDGTTNFTTSGTQVVNLTYSGSVGTRANYFGSSSEANSISLNVTAGTDIITINGPVRNLDFTGFSGTHSFLAGPTVYGNLTLSTGMTSASSTATMTFASTSGTKTITTNGRTIDNPLTFNGVGGTWQLADALTVGSTRTVTLTAGTLTAGAYNLTTGIFSSSGSGVRTINFGSGTWTLTAAGTSWSCATSTNMTTTPGTATISMTAATAKTFAGGGKTYPKLNQGGAGALTITGANTFVDMTATTVPSTITFPASTTTTVYGFSVSGTAGNLATLNSSTAGTRATLSYAAGTIDRDYLSIQDINATGGAQWYAGANSTNVSNNLGWIFTAAPLSLSDVRLRSFTERGRD